MKIYDKIASLFAVMACLASCGIDIEEYKVGDPDSGEELVLTSSAEEAIVLNERDSNDTALGLTWTTGSNFGTGNAISYALSIFKDGEDQTETWSESLGRRIYSRDISVEELNGILTEYLGAVPGEQADYTVRITAAVADHPEMEQYSEISVTVTAYSPAPEILYIIGDMTDGGWTVSAATAMERISGGVFSFECMAEAGDEFRFIRSAGSEWPAYIPAGGDGNTLEFCPEEPAAGTEINFSISETSQYLITANLLDMTVTLEDTMTGTLYLIGDATPGGWDLSELTEMEMTGKGQFSWTGTLTADGEGFKFVTSRNFWPGYVKASDDPDDMTLRYSETELSGEDDRKFRISETATYKIDVNLLTLAVNIAKEGEAVFNTLFMIGDATPGGWTIEDATEMEMTSDGVYTWSGVLNSGSLRFVVTDTAFQPGYWKENDDPADMTMVYSETGLSGSEDRSFNITEDGEYTVTADTKSLTLSIVRTGDVPETTEPFTSLWIIGTASPADNGWSLDDAENNDAVTLKPSADDPYTFTWTGDLKSGELKFSCDLQRDWMGKWYMPEEDKKVLDKSGTEKIRLIDASASGAVDWKWNVTAGNYTISINQLAETMTVTRN